MRRELDLITEDGTALRGVLHYAQDEPSPGIVLAHGFSGVKEQIEHYAAAFAGAGFAALVFDHRGFGSSEGTPRLEVDAMRQIADWRDVLGSALTLPEVDASCGLGLWGSSFAGGLALVIAADDVRVRCVVAQIPNVGLHRGTHLHGPGDRARLIEIVEADRAARLAGAPPGRIPVLSSEPGELCVLPPLTSAAAIAAVEAAAPGWRNEVTVRSIENSVCFEPTGWIREIAPKPLLMIVAANDVVTLPRHQLEAFDMALEPKRLVVHPGNHFSTYSQYFRYTSQAAIDWFSILGDDDPAHADHDRVLTGPRSRQDRGQGAVRVEVADARDAHSPDPARGTVARVRA